MKRLTIVPLILSALALASCDAGDLAGPGNTPAPVASVTVDPEAATLNAGDTRTLTARAFAANGSPLMGRSVAWSSNDTSVISVSASGIATARKDGEATVTALIEGKAGRSTLTVQTPVIPVASVVIEPVSAVTIPTGSTIELRAKTLASDGSELVGRTLTWTSSRPDVASVSGAGLVSGITEGVADITATSEGKSAWAQITVETPVSEPTVGSITVRPSLVVTYAGVNAPLTVTVRAPDGNVISGANVAWSVGDPTAATVDANGVLRGLRAGETTVTATAGGKSATVAATFNTTSTYHLAFDRAASAFLWMDMRTGSAAKTLEHAAGIRATDPSPSPTRSGFAYVYDVGPGSNPSIAIQSWSGLTYQFLTGGDQPAWSPNGARIAFRSTRAGRSDIWSIDADGSTEAVNLTADLPQGVESERPTWSPTGDRIAFAASSTVGRTGLWIMNADGTGKRALTSGPFLDTEPTWFGDRIVFTRRTQLGTSELYWIYVNGALAQPLTALGGAQMPAWSPDGRWIAFVVRDAGQSLGDIFAVRPDGTDVRALSLRSDGPTGGGLNPAWTLHW